MSPASRLNVYQVEVLCTRRQVFPSLNYFLYKFPLSNLTRRAFYIHKWCFPATETAFLLVHCFHVNEFPEIYIAKYCWCKYNICWNLMKIFKLVSLSLKIKLLLILSMVFVYLVLLPTMNLLKLEFLGEYKHQFGRFQNQ